MRFGESVNSLEEYIPFSYKPGMIRLDANESCISLPDSIKAEILNVISKVELNRYPDPYCKDLRKAFGRYYGIDCDNVVVGNGSDELISIIFSSLIPSDSKSLTVAPDFSMYSFYASLYNRKNDIFQKDENYNIDVDEFIDYINKNRYDFVMFSNPCNPTGQGIEKSDILKIVKNTSAMICVDEAYMDFWDESESVCNEVDTYDNLMVLRTLSKAIGLASCRLGFAAANKNIISMFNKVKSPYNVNSVSQSIGCYILNNPDILNANGEFIKKQTQDLYNRIKDLNIKDSIVYEPKTNFVFVKVPTAREIFEKLKNKNIIIRCFGSDRLRITAGTEAENEAVLNALEEMC